MLRCVDVYVFACIMLFMSRFNSCLTYSILLMFICLCYLQNALSVQFDDLFKKAWEEDVTELTADGLYDQHFDILVLSPLFLNFLC